MVVGHDFGVNKAVDPDSGIAVEGHDAKVDGLDQGPGFVRVEMALSAANCPVDQCHAARQADASCARVSFEKLTVR